MLSTLDYFDIIKKSDIIDITIKLFCLLINRQERRKNEKIKKIC